MGPSETLAEHERRTREWLEQLRDRRARLRTLQAELPGVDDEEIPPELSGSLVELLDRLEADLSAQVADLEGDLDRVEDLQGTVEDVGRPEVADELGEYVEELDAVFAEKGTAVEELLDTTDDLVDRFEDLVTGRYRDGDR